MITNNYKYNSDISIKFKKIMFYFILVSAMGSSFIHADKYNGYQCNNDKACHKKPILNKIELTYYHDFHYKKEYTSQEISGCFVFMKKTKNSAEKVLRCREFIYLLRSKKISNVWEKEYNRSGWINLNIPEFGIKNVHAYLVRNKTADRKIIEKNTEKRREINNDKGLVTGTFIRHVLSIKEYTFKNTHTGKIVKIKTTPQHLFYVKNRQSFIPISRVLPTDNLLTVSGEPVKLICAGKNECGRDLHPGRPVPVYNMEVYKHHTYGVGVFSVLVHNTCGLASKLKSRYPHVVYTKSIKKTSWWGLRVEDGSQDFLKLESNNDIGRVFFALADIYGQRNIACDTAALLTASRLGNKHLNIGDLEALLDIRKLAETETTDELLYKYEDLLYKAMSSLGDIKFVPEGESLALSDVLKKFHDTMFVHIEGHDGVIGKRADGFYMFSSWTAEFGPYTAVHDVANNEGPEDYYKLGQDIKILSYIPLNTADTHNWLTRHELAVDDG